MRIVLQRVKSASVLINNKDHNTIDQGMCILLGIEPNDNMDDISWLVRKVINMRIFPDEEGVMNKSILEVSGSFLVISQFTLHASTKKGNRPSYIKAAKPDIAIPLYEKFVNVLKTESKLPVETGEFGADMMVEIWNDGPVTIILDSKSKE